jgi:hypothetical protein
MGRGHSTTAPEGTEADQGDRKLGLGMKMISGTEEDKSYLAMGESHLQWRLAWCMDEMTKRRIGTNNEQRNDEKDWRVEASR